MEDGRSRMEDGGYLATTAILHPLSSDYASTTPFAISQASASYTAWSEL